jgi:hypothetical protein
MKTVITVNAFKALQTTSTLCKAANVTRGQLRLYEEEGLIAPPMATPNCSTYGRSNCSRQDGRVGTIRA